MRWIILIVMTLLGLKGCELPKPHIAIVFSDMEKVEIPESTPGSVETPKQAAKEEVPEGKCYCLVFSISNCPPCNQLAGELQKLRQLGWTISDTGACHFCPVKADDGGAGQAMAQKYRVSRYPTLIMVDTKGNVKDTKIGSMSSEALAAWFNSFVEQKPSPNASQSQSSSSGNCSSGNCGAGFGIFGRRR